MSGSEFVWGILLVASGIFISVYGNMLFRFALAVMGFGIGFSAAVWLTDGQDTSVRVLVGLAVGGIGAFILFSLVRFTLYIAGGILGLIVAFVVGALFEIFGPDLNNIVGTIIAIAGIGLGGYFGSRLGNLIVLLASAAAGAYLIIAGLRVLYESRIGGDVADPTETLAQRLTLALFATFFAVAFLGQFNYRRLRERVLS